MKHKIKLITSHPRWKLLGIAITLILLFVIVGSVIAANDPVSVSFTLEGCKAENLTWDLEANNFICNDGAYTTGNLGKLWNELDLVPHRLTTQAGNSAPDSQTYRVAVVADHYEVAYPGYDVISEPILNLTKSDPSCSVVVGPQTVLEPGVGGTDKSLYRFLDITQNKNTTCVFDYVERLAVGSHLFPGASLHSNLLSQYLDTGGVGNKDVSIPVNEILPQELNKDMSATQNADHVWNITKAPTPASLTFNNTCESEEARKQDVAITIEWERLPATPSGDITVITNIYATNPAARSITINVTDEIYSGMTLLDTADSGDVVISANMTEHVLTHQITVPDGTPDLNDIATASYIDTVTGVPVPGQTTATASAPVQLSGITENTTAVITDEEDITGTDLSFSADSFDPPTIGSFDGGYIAGTPTNGKVEWTSTTQSGAGSVTFYKTVYVDQPAITSGILFDTATLTGSEGFTVSADAQVDISTDALVDLTIVKTIPDVLQGEETETFTFLVTGPDFSEEVTIDFVAGETSNSITLTGLEVGTYTVEELGSTSGMWDSQASKSAYIGVPSCGDTFTFNNTYTPATAKVKKVTYPAGFEANWEFTLVGPGVNETVTTTGNGFIDFTSDLLEGTYTITETTQDGWSQTGDTSCSFTVDYPADAGNVFECTLENTFNPSVTLVKTGDTLSKVGDDVDYTITVTNTSSTGGAAGTPALECTITDGMLGINKNVTLASGASDVTNASYTVQEGDPDPLDNTASVSCTYVGLTDVVASASDDHSVNLFQPSITFDKTGDALSKIGDPTDYTITLTNTSSADTPALTCTVTDAAVGVDETVTLAAGDPAYVITATAAIPAGASDPYVNTAEVSCSVAGFPNVLTASDDHSVNLFQPSINVVKTGDEYSKNWGGQADEITYNVTIYNTSSDDTPNMSLVSFSDTLVPGVTPPADCDDLGYGESCSFSYTYTPTEAEGEGDTLVNTANVVYSPDGFPNQITDDDGSNTHTVTLLHPTWTITKECAEEPVPQEGPAFYTVTFVNTGDADLVITADEDLIVDETTTITAGTAFDLLFGETKAFTVKKVGSFVDQATVDNTINATITLNGDYGLSNEYTDSATGTCDVGSRVTLLKRTGPVGAPVVDPTKSWTFTIWEGPDGFDGTLVASDNTFGDVDGTLEFFTVDTDADGIPDANPANLDPTKTYTLCENEVPSGFSTFWQVDTDGDGIADTTVTPYNPNADDDPQADLGNRCIDIGAGTGIDLLTAGGTLAFRVDNTFPGGEPRTPGYWKNWNRCTGGGQQYTADLNGGWQQGFWLLEDVLDPNIGGGILWDDILPLPGGDDGILFPITDCAVAIDILDQRDIGEPSVVGDGRKQSSIPAYTLAMHLLAAQLNFGAGAATCDAVLDVALQAETLLDEIDFNGTGNYLKKGDQAQLALDLAYKLDEYNNGGLCDSIAVSIRNPNPNDIVSGDLLIDVEVFDALHNPMQVEFFVDGTPIGTDTDGSDGWTWLWDSTSVADGAHVLEAVATNDASETGSADRNFFVDNVVEDNPPTVSITAPADGATVNGDSVDIAVSADDDNGTPDVNVVVKDGDGTEVFSFSGLSATWHLVNGITVPDGEYTIIATATDSIGQTASDSIVVTVDNEPDLLLSVIEMSGVGNWVNPAQWQATVSFNLDPEVSGAVVNYLWGDGTTGSCVLAPPAPCLIVADFSKKVESVTFTVESIMADGYVYTGSDSVIISKPPKQ